MKLNLNPVTLFVLSSVDMDLTMRSQDICTEKCMFKDSIIFTDKSINCNHRIVKTPEFKNTDDVMDYAFHEMNKHITTPFVLSTQWDGYILDTNSWTNDFFEYDFIGSKWPWLPPSCNVGNDGFSLKSKKLLDVLADLNVPKGTVSDSFICQTARPYLENMHGIRFAPESVADRFSFERSAPTGPTFGFHGFYNFWRFMDDKELLHVASRFSKRVVSKPEYNELVSNCLAQGRIEVACNLAAIKETFNDGGV